MTSAYVTSSPDRTRNAVSFSTDPGRRVASTLAWWQKGWRRLRVLPGLTPILFFFMPEKETVNPVLGMHCKITARKGAASNLYTAPLLVDSFSEDPGNGAVS